MPMDATPGAGPLTELWNLVGWGIRFSETALGRWSGGPGCRGRLTGEPPGGSSLTGGGPDDGRSRRVTKRRLVGGRSRGAGAISARAGGGDQASRSRAGLAFGVVLTRRCPTRRREGALYRKPGPDQDLSATWGRGFPAPTTGFWEARGEVGSTRGFERGQLLALVLPQGSPPGGGGS